jgi:putative ABC transport system permease protein
MYWIALKMLFGDTAKYIGIITGLTFASLLMTQQASIFVGLMSRTFGFIKDTGLPDIWVMEPKVQFVDDLKPMQDTQLFRVRSIDGVQWAVPMYRGLLKARLQDGSFQTCNVVGLDDTTLIGGPPVMLEGELKDLRRSDSIIVDIEGATDKLAKLPIVEGGPKQNLLVGDTLEINDKRAIVVGISQGTRTFLSQPTVYTTYNRALNYAPRERNMMSFVLVKARPDKDIKELCADITRVTGMKALTKEEFEWLTVGYFLKNTGIPINFGITVFLGFIVGTAIAGQTFFNFTHDNIRHFGTLKAMGAGNFLLLRMILLQAFTVGLVGYGLGVGLAGLFGWATAGGNAAFRLLWQILAISGSAVFIICVISAFISMIKVFRLEPAIVFKG